MNSSFRIHLEERPLSATVPLSSGMRRFIFESLVTSAALLAIGGLVVLTGGDLGSASTVLHAGRVCLVLSISLSVATALVAVVASHRWPGWKIPPRHIRFLAASALLAVVGYCTYGSQTGRALMAIATGSAIAAVIFYEYTNERSVTEPPTPQKQLADILNQKVNDSLHLSIVFDAEPEALPPNFHLLSHSTQLVDTLLQHGEYETALKLCVSDFDSCLVDIGTIFLTHALQHEEPDSYHELISSVDEETNLYQRMLLNWIALLCRGWATGDATYLAVADEITCPLDKQEREHFLGATKLYRVEGEIKEIQEQLEGLNAQVGNVSLTRSVCDKFDDIERQLEQWIENSTLRLVFRMLCKEADSLSYLRRLVQLLLSQVVPFKGYIPPLEDAPKN